MKRLLTLFIVITALTAAGAQAQVTEKPVSWQVFGGWSGVGGSISDKLDDGWDLGFGVTWRPNPGRSPFGIKSDLSYNEWDAKNIVTAEYRVDDGRARSWTWTVDAVWESNNRGRVGFYGGAGIGGYGLYTELTNSTLVSGIYCDYWGWCYPYTTVGDVIVANDHTIKFGYNAQLGIRFKLANSELALETAYNWVQTKTTFEYYPINVAWRF